MKNKPLSTEEKIMLANISYGIAALILFFFFATLFFLYHKNTQDIIMQHHLDITAYILFLFGFLFTTLGSKLEDAVKKENLKAEIIETYTNSNSIISVINYAREKIFRSNSYIIHSMILILLYFIKTLIEIMPKSYSSLLNFFCHIKSFSPRLSQQVLPYFSNSLYLGIYKSKNIS